MPCRRSLVSPRQCITLSPGSRTFPCHMMQRAPWCRICCSTPPLLPTSQHSTPCSARQLLGGSARCLSPIWLSPPDPTRPSRALCAQSCPEPGYPDRPGICLMRLGLVCGVSKSGLRHQIVLWADSKACSHWQCLQQQPPIEEPGAGSIGQ